MSENEIVLNVLVDADGNELNILTSFVERDVTIVRKMRVPLYVDGQLKSAEELAELDWLSRVILKPSLTNGLPSNASRRILNWPFVSANIRHFFLLWDWRRLPPAMK